jgi:Uma2 family endonuclease
MATIAPDSPTTRSITAEEFARRPKRDDGCTEELVRGEIEIMSRPQRRHGAIQINIGSILKVWCRSAGLETPTLTSETGVRIEGDPDTVRGPDVMLYKHGLPMRAPDGYMDSTPDLVVEIRSPSDRTAKLRAKLREYIDCGVPLIWLVDSDNFTVTVYTGSLRGIEHDTADTLEGGDVLPGFSCKVEDFFE